MSRCEACRYILTLHCKSNCSRDAIEQQYELKYQEYNDLETINMKFPFYERNIIYMELLQ